MAFLALAGLALAAVLLFTAVAWILGWVFWLWQMAMIFGVIPYYLVRALVSAGVWAVRLVRGGSRPTVTITPPRSSARR